MEMSQSWKRLGDGCRTWLTRLMLLGMAMNAFAQHAHLNSGALDSKPGNPLYFANGDRFVAESGYFVPLRPATNGTYAGFHQAALGLTALASTSDFGGPAFGHAAPGTRIEAVVESVTGPEGGEFGFWDSDGEEDATELTFSVPTGEVNGIHRFRLSENDGRVGADPYGHIHGRRFTATLPGLYQVGFRLIDTGGNGPGGGSLHPPSDLFRVWMQAGVTLAGIRTEGSGWAIGFAAEQGFNHWVERSGSIGPDAQWTVVAGPVTGLGKIHWEPVPDSAIDAGFFRLRRE